MTNDDKPSSPFVIRRWSFVGPGSSLRRSVGYALVGIARAFRAERNLRLQSLLALAATGLGLWLGLTPVEWALLALVYGFVLFAELTNTAIELAVDLAAPRPDPLAAAAKDVAAGAVLVAALASALVGLLLFGPRLLGLVR